MADINYIEIVTDGAVIEVDDGTNIVDVNSNSEITVEYSGDSKDANAIRGRTIETGTPADQEVLTWNNSASEWQYLSVDENVDDQVASLIQASSGNGITWTYDDSAGTLTPTLSIRNADVNASAAIAVSKLAASTVNYGGVTLTLGGSDTSPAFNLVDSTGYLGTSSLVTCGSLSSGSIASGFGAIDNGTSSISGGQGTFQDQIRILGSTPTLKIGDGGEEDTRLYFDGNAQDFYIGLDDSVDDLVIGKGSAVGTTPALSIDENLLATFSAGITSTGSANTLGASTFTQVDITAEGDLRLQDNSGGQYVGMDAPATVSASYTLTMPGAVGSVSQVLSLSNTDGTLAWSTPEVGDITSVVAGTGLSGGGTSGAVTLNVEASQTQITAVGALGAGSIASGFTSISTSYTDAKVTSVVAGTLVDVSGTTGDVTVNVDLSELATSTSDGDGDFFAVVDSSNAQKKLTKGNIDLAGFTGTAASATLASTITVTANNATSETVYPLFVDGATGTQGAESDTGLNYNPSSGILTTTQVTGNLLGNVTGNVSGTSATVTGASQSNITSVGTLTSLAISGDATIGDDLSLISDAAVLNFGENSDVSLTHVHDTGLLLNSTMALQFGDSGSYIQQAGDGVLRINGEGTVDIYGSSMVALSNDVRLNSDASVLGFGVNNDVTLTHVHDTGLLLNSTMAIQFNDASQYINAPTATVLDINATDEIELNATTIDINGAVDISGAVQAGSTITVGVDDAGHDVKFFGNTASAYMLWDTSDDDLILGGAAGLVVPDGKLTLASTAVTSTGAELNILDGVTSTTAELNILDGVTSTAAELNILDGVTSTTAELNILDGVTSTTAELNILDGATVVVGEINYLDLGATAVGNAIASKAVVLDSNKDFTGIRNLTATTLIGALTGDASGNAATATALETARTIGGTSFDGTANIAVGLAATATALASARTIGGTSFDGTGNIVPATITVADTTDTSSYVALFESATGSLEPKTDAGITYNAGTGTLTATAFAGPLTGNVTGNASGSAGVATTVTITDNESTNEDNGLVFTSGGTLTGNLGLESDGTMTYNPSTGKITATGFIGALTGNASGSSASCTGNAATATALETARTIGGTSFNGTANIAVGLAATATALASARTIGGTSFDGTANIAVALATDATTLATPRAINGVNFDGSAPITVTAAAGTLSGGTLNSGVTASSLTSVGTLTSVTTSGDITLDATDKIFLDGGSNTYITESAADTISFVAEGIESFIFGGQGNPYLRIQALNTGVGAVQYYEDDGGSGQVLHWQAGVRGADNNYYISENATIHSDYALMISNSRDVTVGGALSKASGSFKIDHVLPSMESTHDLYHSFVESSEAMLIYRGSIELENGTATIQMDEQIGLTTGTFELLVRDAQVYTTNETSWDRVRGSIDGSTLTIECENSDCSDIISWLVVGERMDKHIMETAWTDDDGRPILEREKPPVIEDAVA